MSRNGDPLLFLRACPSARKARGKKAPQFLESFRLERISLLTRSLGEKGPEKRERVLEYINKNKKFPPSLGRRGKLFVPLNQLSVWTFTPEEV